MTGKFDAGPSMPAAPSLPSSSRNGADGAAWIDWPTADDIDDCTEVYADPFDTLDEDNACIDPGDHLWLAKDGDVRCVHCGTPAMPVYATREAT
jgi:hypothetical protein